MMEFFSVLTSVIMFTWGKQYRAKGEKLKGNLCTGFAIFLLLFFFSFAML